MNTNKRSKQLTIIFALVSTILLVFLSSAYIRHFRPIALIDSNQETETEEYQANTRSAQLTSSTAPPPMRQSTLTNEKLYNDQNLLKAGRPYQIASNPTASWFGNWTGNVKSEANRLVTNATNQNKLATMVLYNIPHRDCGSYSAGGSDTSQAYRAWIDSVASGIGKRKALVVLEPDALAQIDCLRKVDQEKRYSDLRYAVNKLTSSTRSHVYIDAGHSNWIPSNVMTERLKKSNVHKTSGFALNVSNFHSTASNTTYGNKLAKSTKKRFVIDTSRNGSGSNGEWCNPKGRSVGVKPSTKTAGYLDAYLWIKVPGESDGTCNGGPAAGHWWPEQAQNLIRNMK